MPEGDTIRRTARTLQRVLGGETLSAVRSAVPAVAGASLAGHRVDRVESRGKNLLIFLDDGRALYTHMRMAGSWHVYRPGERWQRPERQARVVLATERFVAVCFRAPVVELLSAAELARHPALSRLGPDVLAADFDAGEASRRLRLRGEAAVGEALIAQAALAGVGNVYKSETLFLCGIDPFRAVRDLSEPEIDLVIAKARALMAAGAGDAPRATRPSLSRERTWVYGRKGRPCRRCGTPIRMRRQGDQARSTYWCPSCQASSRKPSPTRPMAGRLQ